MTEIPPQQKHRALTALWMQNFMVPERAAAIPNRPLFRMFMATLKPPPTPAAHTRQQREHQHSPYSHVVLSLSLSQKYTQHRSLNSKRSKANIYIMSHTFIIGTSCHKYHFCCDKYVFVATNTFVTTKHVFCCDKSMLATTKRL